MSYRDRQADYMGESRRKERDVIVPPVVDPERRLACEADDKLFLSTYFPDRFTDSWTEDRCRILDQIAYQARYGGDKALAAPRGEGKTSIAECRVGAKAILTGELRFPLIVSATGPDSDRLLSNIKAEYEQNDLLAEDYPEVCACVRALEGAAQRCNMQTVLGERTLMKWSGNYVHFPTIRLLWCPKCYQSTVIERKGHFECRSCGNTYKPWYSRASGAILMTRGLDAAIRGLRVAEKRPDFVMIDDPETQESAASETQTDKRASIIEKDIGGLGGPRKRIARLMLTTLQNAQCLSARYTDVNLKPSWDGERMALVLRWPDRKDLWEKYIDARQEGMSEGDKLARQAHALYVENRAEMDAGAVVSNPQRFSADILPDGSQRELSTIQHVHNEAADKGWDYVFTELQNDPPDTSADDEAKLTPFKVRGSHPGYVGRVNGMSRRAVPEDAEHLTAFIDVQKRTLFYEVVAWSGGRRSSVIDYGNFGDATIADTFGQSESVKANLQDLFQEWRENPYPMPFNMVLVDSGYETAVVHEFCERVGRPWRASMGDARYHHPKGLTSDKKPSRSGDRWYESKVGRVWQINFDPDWWKHRCHDAFTIQPQERPEGCVTLFGTDPKSHAEFGEQICAEEWVEEFKEGKGIKAEWVRLRKSNHYLDCHVGNMVAASMCGIAVGRPRAARNRRYGVLSSGAR